MEPTLENCNRRLLHNYSILNTLVTWVAVESVEGQGNCFLGPLGWELACNHISCTYTGKISQDWWSQVLINKENQNGNPASQSFKHMQLPYHWAQEMWYNLLSETLWCDVTACPGKGGGRLKWLGGVCLPTAPCMFNCVWARWAGFGGSWQEDNLDGRDLSLGQLRSIFNAQLYPVGSTVHATYEDRKKLLTLSGPDDLLSENHMFLW